MVELAATVWRDFVTDGVPSSGPNKIHKQKVRQWGTYLESLANLAFTNGKVYATEAALDADLVPAANTSALVIGDGANDGLYMKVGATTTGSWNQLTDFVPGAQIVHAVDAGAGTPNAIVATSSIGLSASGSQVVRLDVFEANTGSPVTVAFNGGTALTIKTAAGNDVAAGGLTVGPVLGTVSGTTFRLLSDQASASIVAAAEAAKVAAESAAGANLHAADSRAAAILTNIPAPVNYVRTAGYGAAGDVGNGLYKKVASAPAHAARFQSADGAHWELAEGARIEADQVGAVGDEIVNDQTAVQTAVTLRGSTLKRYLVNTITSISNGWLKERLVDTNVVNNPVARIANGTVNYKITGRLESLNGQGVNDVSVGASKIFVLGAEFYTASFGWLSDVGSNLKEVIFSTFRGHAVRGSVIELNSPNGTLRDFLLNGLILSTGSGSTFVGSGWLVGIAGVKGWIISNLLGIYSRQEAIHVEDEQLDGLIANVVVKCSHGHGAYLSRSAVSAGQGECDGFNVGNVSFKHASVVPELIAASTTSLTIGLGSQTWAVPAGKAYEVNMTLHAASDADAANYMEGFVTAVDAGAGSVTVNVTAVGGAGTFADWTLKVKRSGKYGIYQVSAADGGLPWMSYSNVRVRGYEHGFNLGAGSGRRNSTISSGVAMDCDFAANLTAGASYRGSVLAANCPTLIRANNGSVAESIVSDTVPTQILSYVGSTTNIGAIIEHVQFPRLLTHGGVGTETFDLIDMPLNMKARVTLSLNNANTNFFGSWDVTYSGTTFTLEDTASVRHQNMGGATLINNAGKLALQVSASAAITAKTMIVDVKGQIYANADIMVY